VPGSLATVAQHDERRIVAEAVGICWFAGLLIWPACARSVAQIRLEPEQTTTLHVGQTAAVLLDSSSLYRVVGSAGGSLVLTGQVTNNDGSKVYVYRAVDVGPGVLVAAPEGRQAGDCISCVTTHYFIKVVP